MLSKLTPAEQAFMDGVNDRHQGLGFRPEYDRAYDKAQIRAYENGRIAEQHSPGRGRRFMAPGTLRANLFVNRGRNARLDAAYAQWANGLVVA